MATTYRKDTVQRLTDEEDLFAHRDYASALVEAIREVPSPFTLGLFAPWGSGKSSILHEVGEQLRQTKEIAYVYFDVWRYEGDSLRREFIRDVATQLKNQGVLGRFDIARHIERFDADIAETPRSRLIYDRSSLLRGCILGVLAALLILAIVQLAPRIGFSDRNADKVVLALIGASLTFLVTAFGNVIRSEPIQVTRRRFEDPDQFAENFSDLLGRLKRKRLAIGVDNLDRCAPNRVAELLATIKTFLEPAVEDKELVFVVAADVAALRRHLIAQELAESGGGAIMDEQSTEKSERPASEHVPRDVQDAVDEYLRKFFNGSLGVVEVLDEDIRDFAEKQLAEFRENHNLDDEATGELVELIGSALKRNPRRIKQFINNVELRLQILDHRHKAGRIQLDADPLVVAKLTIIEEQWPDRHDELNRDPRLLQRWHREAADGNGDVVGDVSQKDRDWAVFLRLTETIRPSDLRPYLTLKQSTTELQLPRYREFADALEGGELEALTAFLDDDENAGKREEYLAAVPALFGQSVQRGFYGAANNIVRAVIGVSALIPIAPDVLAEALPHPEIRRRLAELAPEPLLAAAEGLGEPRFNQVVGILMEKFEAAGEGSGADRFDVSEALAGRLERLSSSARRRIAEAFETEEIRRDFGSYLPLAKAAPELIPKAAVKDATNALESLAPFGVEEAAYQVSKAQLAGEQEPAYADIQRLGDAVILSLFALMADEEGYDRYRELAADAAAFIGQFDVPHTSFQESVERFDREWAQIPVGLKSAALDVVGALLDAGTESSRDQYRESFTNRFFDELPAEAISWSRERSPNFGQTFTTPVDGRLSILASGAAGDDEMAGSALEVIERLPRQRAGKAVAQAISAAVDNGRYERAGVFLADHRDLLDQEWTEGVDRLLAAGEQDPSTDHPGLLSALAGLDIAQMSDEQRDRLGKYVAQGVISQHDGAGDAFKRVSRSKKFSEVARTTVGRVFDHVSGNQGQLSSNLPQIEFLVNEQSLLSESQRFQLGTMLVERTRDYPHESGELAPLSGRLEQLSADERHALVTNLILAERAFAEQQAGYGPYREPVLRAAGHLAGTRASRAKKAVDERLAELSKGSDDDKSLVQRLTE
jgi:hypothetical protein